MDEQATVTLLRPVRCGTDGHTGRWGAVEAFLAVDRARSATTTARAYTGVLTRVADHLGPDRPLAEHFLRRPASSG